MTFADDVRQETKSTGVKCRVCVFLEGLDTKTRSEVTDVLADEAWNSEAISRAMNRRGWEFSGAAIRKHRQKCIVR
jgi:hypothetical protein